MKSKIFSALFVAVALLANVVKAENPNNPAIDLKKEGIEVAAVNKTLLVKITEIPNEVVSVSIESPEFGRVFAENFTVNSSVLKRFDLSKLEVGSYRLTIKKAGITTVQPFEVDFGKIQVITDKIETYYSPRISQKGDKVLVSYLSTVPSTLNVVIYNNAGISIFEEKYETTNFQKAFSLSKLPKGVYFVEVSSDSTETESFTVKL